MDDDTGNTECDKLVDKCRQDSAAQVSSGYPSTIPAAGTAEGALIDELFGTS